MFKIKNLKLKPSDLLKQFELAKMREKELSHRAILVIIFIAFLSPVFLGLFQTKSAGSTMPAIWYDRRSGLYKASVAAIVYTGVEDDDDTTLDENAIFEGKPFHFTGPSDIAPFEHVEWEEPLPPGFEEPTPSFGGCSGYIDSSGVFGPEGEGVMVCFDVHDDSAGQEEPGWVGQISGFDGTENIGAITMFWGPSHFFRMTIFGTNSAILNLIDYLKTNRDSDTGIIHYFESVFVSHGTGKDYTLNPSPLKELINDGVFDDHPKTFFSDNVKIDSQDEDLEVSFWGGNGTGDDWTRDEIAPASIEPSTEFGGDGTLSAETAAGGVGGRVKLTWKAAGDNGDGLDDDEKAYEYFLRYSSDPIEDEKDFENASDYPSIMNLIPASPGEDETFVVSGLNPGEEYYFAIKACDEFKLCGSISGSVWATASLSTPGTKLPEIWYDRKSGMYRTSVAAIEYISGDPDLIGDYRYSPNFSCPPDIGYLACSIFSRDGSFGDSMDGGVVCDIDDSDTYGEKEPFSSSSVFDGTEDIAVVTVGANFPGMSARVWTILVPNSKVGDLINSIDDIEPGLTVTPITSAFSAPSDPGGKYPYSNYKRNNLPAGVIWWGGDGVGGTRDNIPPKKISLSSSRSDNGGEVTLSWKNVGDNGDGSGDGLPAYEYFLRYSLSPIDSEEKFNTATDYEAIKDLVPGTPGDTQTYSISGLDPNKKYYFALKVCDQYQNCSEALSASEPPIVHTCTPTLSFVDDFGVPLPTAENGLPFTENRLVNLQFVNCGRNWLKIVNGSPSSLDEASIISLSSVTGGNKWDLCSGGSCLAGTKQVYFQMYENKTGPPYSSVQSASIVYQTVLADTKFYINNKASRTENKTVSLSFENIDFGVKSAKILNLETEDFVEGWEKNISRGELISNFTPDEDGSRVLGGWDLCRGLANCSYGDKWVIVQLYGEGGVPLSKVLKDDIYYGIGEIEQTITPTLAINGGAEKTSSNGVTLSIGNTGDLNIISMQIRNSGGAWVEETFSSFIPWWDICADGGCDFTTTKTVEVILRDFGGKTFTIIDSIVYEVSAEEKPIEKPMEKPTEKPIDGGGTGGALIPTLTIMGVEGNSEKTSDRNVALIIDSKGLVVQSIKVRNFDDLSYTDYPGSLLSIPWDICKNVICDVSADKKVVVILQTIDNQLITLEDSIFLEIISGETPIVIPPIITFFESISETTKEVVEKYGSPIITLLLVGSAYASYLSIASSFADLMAILRYLAILILQALGIRPKNKNWGVVYNSATKTPLSLCIVRLFNAKTGALEQTSVTDKQGRFGLFPAKGWYYLGVTKPFFSFPSQVLKGVSNDIGYNQLYFGEKKFLTGSSVVNFAIPMDKAGQRIAGRKLGLAVRSFLINISTPIAVFGALLALFVLTINPTIFNVVIFSLHLSVLALKKALLTPPRKPYIGIINKDTGRPMAGVALKIFSKKYDKLITTKVSDKYGKFDLFLPDGQYYLRTASNKLDFVKDEKGIGYGGEVLNISKEGLSRGLRIYLRQKS